MEPVARKTFQSRGKPAALGCPTLSPHSAGPQREEVTWEEEVAVGEEGGEEEEQMK